MKQSQTGKLRQLAILAAIAGLAAGSFFIMSDVSVESGDKASASGTASEAPADRNDPQRPRNIAEQTSPQAPWPSTTPPMETHASVTEVIEQSRSARQAIATPCDPLHGRWHAADGSSVVLLANGRAEYKRAGSGVTPIRWACHKSGTLELWLPDGTASLELTADGRLVGRDINTPLAPLTRLVGP